MGVIAQLCLGNATSGFPILASGPVNWQLKAGVLPVMAEFHLTPDAHQQILKYSSKPEAKYSLKDVTA